MALIIWGIGIWHRMSRGQTLPDARWDSGVAAACFFAAWWVYHLMTRRNRPPVLPMLMAIIVGDGERRYSVPRMMAIALATTSTLVVFDLLADLWRACRTRRVAEPDPQTGPMPENAGR